MEAQIPEELECYLLNLNNAFHLIADEIAALRKFKSSLDLFELLRIISPETCERHPNKYRQTLVQVGAHVCPKAAIVPYCIGNILSFLRADKRPYYRRNLYSSRTCTNTSILRPQR
jgi:hypothetical protein